MNQQACSCFAIEDQRNQEGAGSERLLVRVSFVDGINRRHETDLLGYFSKRYPPQSCRIPGPKCPSAQV